MVLFLLLLLTSNFIVELSLSPAERIEKSKALRVKWSEALFSLTVEESINEDSFEILIKNALKTAPKGSLYIFHFQPHRLFYFY